MFQRILVPLDGSQRAERAVPVAARVAQVTGGSLVLLQVLSAPAELLPFVAPALEPATLSADESAAMNYLKSVSMLAPGVSTELAVRTGLAANMIANVADSSHVDAIFLTSDERGSLLRRLLGGIPERVSHTSPVPVLVQRETLPSVVSAPSAPTVDAAADPAGSPTPASPDQGYLRVLIPLDGTPEGEAALPSAAMLAAALSSPGQGALQLIRILSLKATAQARGEAEAYLTGVIARLRAESLDKLNVAADWAIAEGKDAADMVLQIAGNAPNTGKPAFNLVALATPPAKRAHRWPFDHVIDRVLRSTTLSLLLVHPGATPHATP